MFFSQHITCYIYCFSFLCKGQSFVSPYNSFCALLFKLIKLSAISIIPCDNLNKTPRVSLLLLLLFNIIIRDLADIKNSRRLIRSRRRCTSIKLCSSSTQPTYSSSTARRIFWIYEYVSRRTTSPVWSFWYSTQFFDLYLCFISRSFRSLIGIIR